MPEFLTNEIQISGERMYRPRSMSHRGEYYAYGFALSVGLATMFLRHHTGKVSLVGVFINGLFLIVGLVLTFGAWMERGTRITLSEETLVVKNPLKNVNFPWVKVFRMHAMRLRERWKIAVFNDTARIIFSTEFPEDSPGPERTDSVLINGPMLAAVIRTYAKLSDPTWQENVWTCERTGGKGG